MAEKVPVWERIRVGFRAGKTFTVQNRREAEDLARNRYKIPETYLTTLTRRVLNAAIRTIQLHTWQPSLIRRMVQSQALVYRWQQGKINDKEMQRFRGVAERYVRKQMGRSKGSGITVNQELVCDEAVGVFIQKISNPDFVLTSSLDTYLIGIAVRRVNAFYRYQKDGPVGNPFQPAPVANKPPDETSVDLVDKSRFYHRAHQLVARELSSLDDKCLTIILQYYGIDPDRLETSSVLAESTGPMTHAEFDALFKVSAATGNVSRKLKDIAVDLGISPKKISQHHLACVDRLVERVLPVLLDESTSAFAEQVREEMSDRLAEARIRRQKK